MVWKILIAYLVGILLSQPSVHMGGSDIVQNGR